MFDLMNLGDLIPQLPVPDIRIRDLQIDIEPSDIFLLPTIHNDARIDIRFPW